MGLPIPPCKGSEEVYNFNKGSYHLAKGLHSNPCRLQQPQKKKKQQACPPPLGYLRSWPRILGVVSGLRMTETSGDGQLLSPSKCGGHESLNIWTVNHTPIIPNQLGKWHQYATNGIKEIANGFDVIIYTSIQKCDAHINRTSTTWRSGGGDLLTAYISASHMYYSSSIGQLPWATRVSSSGEITTPLIWQSWTHGLANHLTGHLQILVYQAGTSTLVSPFSGTSSIRISIMWSTPGEFISAQLAYE